MDAVLILIGMLLSAAVGAIVFYKVAEHTWIERYEKATAEFDTQLSFANDLIEDEQKKYAKLLSQKKSSEVRVGKIGEHLAPFLTDWPFDSNNFRFIGTPIDGIQFNEDGIVFVEIKTGKSRLAKNQKNIKDLIEQGKVKFGVFRIGEDKVEYKED
jgi:predicted Holliday junction resolvase-like endonuclease